MMSGKAGVLHLHLGDGPRGLELVRRALDADRAAGARVPPDARQPQAAPVRRGGRARAGRGVTVDVTAFPVDDDDDACACARRDRGVPRAPGSRSSASRAARTAPAACPRSTPTAGSSRWTSAARRRSPTTLRDAACDRGCRSSDGPADLHQQRRRPAPAREEGTDRGRARTPISWSLDERRTHTRRDGPRTTGSSAMERSCRAGTFERTQEHDDEPGKIEGDRQQRGWIVPIGGAEDKEGDVEHPPPVRRRLAAARARASSIIPTASKLEDTGRALREALPQARRRRGEVAAATSSATTPASAEWLELHSRRATGIFLTGGNQLRLVDDPRRHRRSRRRSAARNARGVTVGGTCAGAAILCEHMIAFGEEGATPRAGRRTLAPGFGLTNRVIIDQHFRQRDRLGRLLAALAYNPFAVGLGLDEDTAAFIDPDDMIDGRRRRRASRSSTPRRSRTRRSAQASEGEPVCMTGRAAARPHRRRARSTCETRTARHRHRAARTPMKILERRVYRGPNLYAHFPVMRLTVDLGALEAVAEREDPRLRRPPARGAADASSSTPARTASAGGFVRRLTEDEGTWLGHVLEHVAIELQQLTGAKVTFGKTRGDGDRRASTTSSTSTRRSASARPPATSRIELLALACCPPELRADAPSRRAVRLRDRARRARSTSRSAGSSARRPASLVRAAEARDIPWMRLNDYIARPVRPRQVPEAHPGDGHERDPPHRGRDRLRQGRDQPHPRRPRPAGAAPAPRALAPRTRCARPSGSAIPVVVKPLDANHGRGVSLDLKTDDEVRVAFDKAREHARSVVVETFLAGFDHRMLVVGGELDRGRQARARPRRRRRRAHDRRSSSTS